MTPSPGTGTEPPAENDRRTAPAAPGSAGDSEPGGIRATGTARQSRDTGGASRVSNRVEGSTVGGSVFQYLLKEGLRTIYRISGTEGAPAAAEALDHWLSRARRSRTPVFVELARKVQRHHDAILHAIVEELGNGLIESTNTKTGLIIRRGFGFRSAEAVIALVMLCLGGNRPTLPRRQLT
ncbi:transposase [Kitasatospora sp. NPDC056651]|uniref:transposase n=1 Tax=Kitasatospora sp. NPDC056651 TaxID=3345892 RepID=UPI0036CF6CE9